MTTPTLSDPDVLARRALRREVLLALYRARNGSPAPRVDLSQIVQRTCAEKDAVLGQLLVLEALNFTFDVDRSGASITGAGVILAERLLVHREDVDRDLMQRSAERRDDLPWPTSPAISASRRLRRSSGLPPPRTGPARWASGPLYTRRSLTVAPALPRRQIRTVLLPRDLPARLAHDGYVGPSDECDAPGLSMTVLNEPKARRYPVLRYYSQRGLPGMECHYRHFVGFDSRDASGEVKVVRGSIPRRQAALQFRYAVTGMRKSIWLAPLVLGALWACAEATSPNSQQQALSDKQLLEAMQTDPAAIRQLLIMGLPQDSGTVEVSADSSGKSGL